MAALITLGIAVLILFPLSFVRATQGVASSGLLLASYVIGLELWMWGLILTYSLWGFWAVILGLVILGIGVVPIAILATLLNGMWSQLIELLVTTAVMFGIRTYSLYVAAKSEDV